MTYANPGTLGECFSRAPCLPAGRTPLVKEDLRKSYSIDKANCILRWLFLAFVKTHVIDN